MQDGNKIIISLEEIIEVVPRKTQIRNNWNIGKEITKVCIYLPCTVEFSHV
jgi:hypothetical protein